MIFMVPGTVIFRIQPAMPRYMVAPGRDVVGTRGSVDVSVTLGDGVLGRLVDPGTCRSQGPVFPLRAWPRETKLAGPLANLRGSFCPMRGAVERNGDWS